MDSRISKAKIKLYASLDTPKGRRKAGIFVAEGTKCVLDIARRYQPVAAYALPQWCVEHPDFQAVSLAPFELGEITRLSDPPPVIAFFKLPEARQEASYRGFTIALDGIQDPGNLGTIIRMADWMGIGTIVASPETADCFNPKAVQASMGALAGVDIIYTPLGDFLEKLPVAVPVYGTYMDGVPVYDEQFSSEGVLVMGNEGHGIAPDLAPLISRRISIPPVGTPVAESLNVGVATAMILAARATILNING